MPLKLKRWRISLPVAKQASSLPVKYSPKIQAHFSLWAVRHVSNDWALHRGRPPYPEGDRKGAPLLYTNAPVKPSDIVGAHPCGRPRVGTGVTTTANMAKR